MRRRVYPCPCVEDQIDPSCHRLLRLIDADRLSCESNSGSSPAANPDDAALTNSCLANNCLPKSNIGGPFRPGLGSPQIHASLGHWLYTPHL